MRNYVIINGINSLTIPGLAIRTLPPISKPAMRNMIEEIDGRDGDIITKLGYAAYDKQMEIGIYGDPDINQIIAFFNTEGTITFSDESDKVYNFQILNQIDYEALIKFRSASVTLHCQPFKYPLTETPFEKTIELINGSGTSVSLTNTAAETFPKFDMKGNTNQTETPTPEAPIEVDVVSGNNEITISNGTDSQSYNIDLPVENLFDESTIETGKVIANDGAINDAVGFCAGDYIKVNPGTKYTISFVLDTSLGGENIMRVAFYTADKTFISRPNSSNNPYTITTPNNCGYIRLSYALASHTQVQVEEGNKANKYQAFGGERLELCKIGTAQDYIYKSEGNWYKHEAVKKITLNGTETWQQDAYASTGFYRYLMTIRGTTYAQTTNINALNNYFEQRINQGHGAYEYLYLQGSPSGINIYIQIQSTSTLSAFLEWLTSHNIDVYYQLQTPEEIQIIDGELIAQLEEIQNATSYENTTNITQTNNDLPFILDVAAIKKGSNTATITNEGNIYSKPTIDIVGTGIIGFYIGGIQKLQIDMNDVHEMIIDTETMEAYNPTTNQLTNRLVTGDYSKIKLDPGENELAVSGNITRAKITKYTRWL